MPVGEVSGFQSAESFELVLEASEVCTGLLPAPVAAEAGWSTSLLGPLEEVRARWIVAAALPLSEHIRRSPRSGWLGFWSVPHACLLLGGQPDPSDAGNVITAKGAHILVIVLHFGRSVAAFP